MGLFGMRDRLTLVGGHVDLTSVPGEGTSVTLRAPRGAPTERRRAVPTEPARTHTPESLPTQPRTDAEPLRVLIADDIALCGVGDATGQEPDSSSSRGAEQERSLARALRPDLLVLDIAMPRMNGVEVAAELSREIPSMKIVGLSMHERDELGNAMRAAGASAYVTKVAPSEVLLGVLRSLAAMREPR